MSYNRKWTEQKEQNIPPKISLMCCIHRLHYEPLQPRVPENTRSWECCGIPPVIASSLMLLSWSVLPVVHNQPNKQNVASLIGRFFDLLGILAPVTMKFKLFFQKLCQENLSGMWIYWKSWSKSGVIWWIISAKRSSFDSQKLLPPCQWIPDFSHFLWILWRIHVCRCSSGVFSDENLYQYHCSFCGV